MPVCTRSSSCATVRYSQIHTFIHPRPSLPPTRPSIDLKVFCCICCTFYHLSTHPIISFHPHPPILWTLIPTLPSTPVPQTSKSIRLLLLYVCRCVPVTVARVPRSPFSPVGSSSFPVRLEGKRNQATSDPAIGGSEHCRSKRVACIRYRYLDSSSDTHKRDT